MEWTEINSKIRIPVKPIKFPKSPERGKYGKIIWTDEMIHFLKENFNKMTNRELASCLNLKLTKVRDKCYEMGLKRMEMEYWTKDQVDFLLAYYQIMGVTGKLPRFLSQCGQKTRNGLRSTLERRESI